MNFEREAVFSPRLGFGCAQKTLRYAPMGFRRRGSPAFRRRARMERFNLDTFLDQFA